MEGKIRFGLLLSLVLLQMGSVVRCLTDGEESTLMRIVSKCLRSDDVGMCLRWKVANALDRLDQSQEPLAITDNVLLIKNSNSNSVENSSADEILRLKNMDVKDWESEPFKNEKLDRFIWEKIADIFSTRTIQISLPRETFEARGQMDKIFKKGHGIFTMIAMLGSFALKMALTKIAFVAGKALVIAKIALILSLVIGFRRFLGRQVSNAEVAFNSVEQEANGWMRRHGYEPRRSNYGANLAYNAHNKLKIKQI